VTSYAMACKYLVIWVDGFNISWKFKGVEYLKITKNDLFL